MTGRPHKPTPSGAFGEPGQEPRRVPIQSERAPKGTYVAEEDDWGGPDPQALTVPPDERPSHSGVPGSIEEAVLQMLEQVPTSSHPSPELPPGTVPPPPRKTVRPR